MTLLERRRSPRQAAKALIVAGAVGVLALAGVSGAHAQRDDLYDDSPSGTSGIFGDNFPGGVFDDDFPNVILGDEHTSGGDVNVGGNSGGSIMVGGNSGGGISIGGSGMSGGGGGSGNGAGGGGGYGG